MKRRVARCGGSDCRLRLPLALAASSLVVVAVLVCVFFGGVSGSGPADAAAMGAVLIPAMTARGIPVFNAPGANANAVKELVGMSFENLFADQDRKAVASKLANGKEFNQVRHVHKNGRMLFVNIRISPSEYTGKQVLPATASRRLLV